MNFFIKLKPTRSSWATEKKEEEEEEKEEQEGGRK